MTFSHGKVESDFNAVKEKRKGTWSDLIKFDDNFDRETKI